MLRSPEWSRLSCLILLSGCACPLRYSCVVVPCAGSALLQSVSVELAPAPPLITSLFLQLAIQILV